MLVARPFAQVQAEVAALLKNKILVGHALGNDLKVSPPSLEKLLLC